MIVSYIQGFQDIYIYTCIFFFSNFMSENDSVLVSHFGSDDVSKFQPAEASYQIHEAWEESGSPGSEGRFGVFAVSSLFADSFSF